MRKASVSYRGPKESLTTICENSRRLYFNGFEALYKLFLVLLYPHIKPLKPWI